MIDRKTDIPNDQQLMIKLKNQERAAFESVYNNYSKKLYYYALKFVKSPEIAEDIMHDVFVKLWEHATMLNPEASLQAYLYKMTRNSLLNLIKRGNVEERIVEEIMNHAEQFTLNTEEQIQYRETLAQANKAIGELPPKRKQIFEMSRDKGMTHRQIALQLEITDSTVNNQLVKAIKSIKNYLYLNGTVS